MQQNRYVASPQKDYYGLKLALSLSILLILLASTSLYIIQNYYSKSFFDFSEKKTVFFLNSDTLEAMYIKNNMNYDEYKDRVKYIKKLTSDNMYDVKSIYAKDLKDIDKNSILVALDMMSLSDVEIKQITSFVSKGGKILFNYTSGFLDNSLKYRENNLVKNITNLQLNKNINAIKLDSNSSSYISTKLASPITKYLTQGQAIDLSIYDPLPLFTSKGDAEADGYLTNWLQTNYIKVGKTKKLNTQESTIIWHGHKENGKWVYFTFPSYAFVDSQSQLYTKLYKGMLKYLEKTITIVPYPYIDAKNAVFVSEDTEYRYENLKQFYDVSLKHKFPVTAFCVANLAEKYSQLMNEVKKSPYLEIGSHSYTHKKIIGQSDEVYNKESGGSQKLLHKLTNKNIIGFRAPREEVDDKFLLLLEQYGFEYILNKGENRLSPYFKKNILVIPRHATDDYSYLINLDWNSSQILNNMIEELHTVVNLNGMYTLSVHTHLMTFGSNIKILDKFFAYINKQKEMHPMNGKMLSKRIKQKFKMDFSTQITQKKIIMSITNNNDDEVENMHYEIDVDPTISLKNVESEIIGLKSNLTKLSDSKYLLVVKSLKAKSKVVLFLNYAKNN